MKKINSSPDRHKFQLESAIKSSDSDIVKSAFDLYKSIIDYDFEKVNDPEWQKNNLEYDLRTTTWICDKVKSSKIYAQNLYCALCNNDFQKLETIPILKGDKWSCSWRHAGGIIADMLETGDYIDWYCSGIRDEYSNGYVSEGIITEEIKIDLQKLKWIVLIDND